MPAHQLAKLSPREKEMAKGLGIQPHIVEAVLNHVSGSRGGVAGIITAAPTKAGNVLRSTCGPIT